VNVSAREIENEDTKNVIETGIGKEGTRGAMGTFPLLAEVADGGQTGTQHRLVSLEIGRWQRDWDCDLSLLLIFLP
jgi:hypothetical protein